jgi:hypothetical protein
MIPDRTGRFRQRPYWESSELDERSEQTITAFLCERYGFDRIPVPTEAFTLLIERDAADFDLATDLSDGTYETFGVTLFHRGGKPTVKIARELWEQRNRGNRLRMTLAHEYGHVMLHTSLYDQYALSDGPQRCYWKDLLPTSRVVDWAEWQAGYAGGALLMPESFMRRAVSAYFRSHAQGPPVSRKSPDASQLAQRIALTFEVSPEAATVRLNQLGFMTE